VPARVFSDLRAGWNGLPLGVGNGHLQLLFPEIKGHWETC
jgi:hypothetical protein